MRFLSLRSLLRKAADLTINLVLNFPAESLGTPQKWGHLELCHLEKRTQSKTVRGLRYPRRRDREQNAAAVKTDFPYRRRTGRMP